MKRLLPLCAMLFLPVASPVLASDATPSGESGEKQALASQGIVLTAGYTSEDFINMRGGDSQSLSHAGQTTLGAHLDLDKLAGMAGSELQMTVTYRDGDNIEDNGVDTLLQPQEIYGRDQTWRLTELWWGQQLFGSLVHIKLGRLTVGNEFGDVECTFVNQGLCGSEPGNINGDYWYNWPISQWAAVGQINLDPTHYLKLGAYQVNPGFLVRHHQFALNPAGTIGALFPVEYGWTPVLDGDRAGSYKIGAWYTNVRRSDVVGDIDSAGDIDYRMRDGAYGAYFTIEQQLTRGRESSAKSGLRMFVNGTYSDRRTSSIDQTLAVGAIYRGLFPGRPLDEIGIGASDVRANARAVASEARLYQQGLLDAPLNREEVAAELFYGWQATHWLRFQPEIQWIHHPGNSIANQGDFAIVGVKTSIVLW